MDFLLTALIYFAISWVFYSQLTSFTSKFFPRLYQKIENYLCFKCFTFWSTLILTWGNLPLAAIASIGAYFYEKNNNSIEL